MVIRRRNNSYSELVRSLIRPKLSEMAPGSVKPTRLSPASKALQQESFEGVLATFQTELIEHTANMKLCSAFGDVQVARDLLVGETSEQKLQYLAFPSCQGLVGSWWSSRAFICLTKANKTSGGNHNWLSSSAYAVNTQ